MVIIHFLIYSDPVPLWILLTLLTSLGIEDIQLFKELASQLICMLKLAFV